MGDVAAIPMLTALEINLSVTPMQMNAISQNALLMLIVQMVFVMYKMLPTIWNVNTVKEKNCVPGCVDDSKCPENNGFTCSSSHICNHSEGKIILKNIKIYTTSCDGCTEEGLKLQLNGDQQVVNKVHCETNILNTPADNEFANGAETVFDKKVTVGVFEDNAGYLNAPLGGVLTDSTYTWTGTGTWKGDKVCVEWEGEDAFAATCRFEAAGKVTDCGKETGIKCP